MNEEIFEADREPVLGPNDVGLQLIQVDEKDTTPTKLPPSHRQHLERKYGKPKPPEPPANGPTG